MDKRVLDNILHMAYTGYMFCDTPTRKGKPCRVPVDINLHPTTCHIHISNGNFQKKLKNPRVNQNIQTFLNEDEKNIIRYWKDVVQ